MEEIKRYMKVLPAFKSEAEEAQWWFDTREERALEFLKAMEEGRVTRGRLAARVLKVTQNIKNEPEAK